MKDESGAVLLLVLIGLALLAALAGMALRLDRAGLTDLRAETVLEQRRLLDQSAMALVAARLNSLPADGTPLDLTVEGSTVGLRLYAVEGLVNPAHALLPVLRALLAAKGASPDQALALGQAIVAARAQGRMRGPWDLAPLLPPALAARIAPDLTFLGHATRVNPALAPPDLRDALAGLPAGIDLSRPPMAQGLYEVDLTLPSNTLSSTASATITRHSVLQDRAGHLHLIARSWPFEAAPP